MVKPTPADDYEFKTFEFDGETYRVKSKFKIFKFFKLLNENPILGLEQVVEEEDFARLEEVDMTMEDLQRLVEAISQAISGSNSGN
jgi:hypothetical protein